MMLRQIGTILMVLGGGLVLGGGGLPVRGPQRYRALLAEYRKAKVDGLKPSGEQTFAYLNHLCNAAGIPMAVFGLFLWIIGFGLEE